MDNQEIITKDLKPNELLNYLNNYYSLKERRDFNFNYETKIIDDGASLGIDLKIYTEVFILGKNIIYSCDKNYRHNELPATINENRIVTFNSKGIIVRIDINTDYVFNDIDYYNEFKNKSYFYKYVEEADTYKFDDTNYTYRVFSKIDVNTDYFLPDNKEELISYFENDGYNCKIKEE